MSKSIYELICKAMENGQYPEGFIVPDDNFEEGDFPSMPGEMDCEFYLHGDYNAHDEAEAALLDEAMRKGMAGDFSTADELFSRLSKTRRAVTAVYDISDWLFYQSELSDTDRIREFALYLMTQSEHQECVRFGLMIRAAGFPNPREEDKAIVRILGRHADFALPAVWNIALWPGGNDELFDMAKTQRDWGKTIALLQLKPETEEIRNWILFHGIENIQDTSVAASACWKKSEAEKRLFCDTLSQEEYTAVMNLLAHVADAEKTRLRRFIDDRETVLKRALEINSRFAMNVTIAEALLMLREYAEDDESLSEVRDMADRILKDHSDTEAVKNAHPEKIFVFYPSKKRNRNAF